MATSAGAQTSGAPCRLALVFALDVSSSVDAEEYALQRDGLSAALLSPDLAPLLLPGGQGRVALAAYEWSGRHEHAVRLDWTLIETLDDIRRAAAGIGAATRSQTAFPTALGYALGFGATMLARGPDCAERKIDISGDGRNNEGFAPRLAYRAFPFEGVIVNGLAIENQGEDDDIAGYYRDVVIRGPGAFVIRADGYGDFRRAMHLKLLRELGAQLIGGLAPAGDSGLN